MVIITFISVFARVAFASTDSFGLLDARAKGVFNIGPGKGNVTKSLDETINKDVLKFNYSVPKGSIIGVWTKDYPAGLGADTADAVKIGIRVPNTDQVNQVSVNMEIKGTKNIQTIPLNLEPGWNSFLDSINWNIIGDLKEIVFVVNPMAVGPMAVNPIGVSPMEISAPVTGILYFDLEFVKLTFLQKNFTFVKVGMVLLIGLLIALAIALLGWLFGLYRSCGQLKTINDEPDSLQASTLSRLKWDFVYGMVIVSVIGTALWVYFLGTMSPLDPNFCFLAAGLIGAVIAELLKLGITGKHLTPGEVFQNVLLVGFLAATSSRQKLLQAPATWAQVLMISNLLASLTFLIYQVSNVCSLILSGKHLRAVTGALIAGTPYLLGWLLLLENASLLQTLGGCISAGALDAWPVILGIMGRLLIVFCFNEAVINGISMVVKGKIIKTPKVHLFTLFVSLSCVLSVDIANLGSTAAVASLPAAVRFIVSILTTMLSHAGLWGEVYLITGMILDGIHRNITSLEDNISSNTVSGMKKGMAYSGILMTILYTLNMLINAPSSQAIMTTFPIMVGIISGALVFPLVKTIIESFDGSLPFCDRMRYNYRDASLYARGAVSGFGFAYMITHTLFQQEMPDRIIFGLIIGLVASVGVSFLRDLSFAFRGQGRIQSWRLYFIDSLLGAFIGSAVAFYLDSSQVPVVIEKFKLYTSAGLSAVDYVTYPLVNKWGRIDLGSYTGGVKLLFIEALAGVINWSVAAWLFAINRVFIEAFFQKDRAPIKFFFSKAGFVDLVKHMLHVLRWGLWMSPIIFTFLRMMPNPTWYNQDGAIRTLFAAYHNMTMSPEAFRDWSLKIFVYIMAFDFFRVLIWMDHMGLRVATLVNLSFIGMDKLDERISRFIGPAAAQRYIPEAVKRFTTWGPLLLPFYLPRGEEWDSAWGASQAMQNAAGGKGIFSTLESLTLPQMLFLIIIAVLVCTGISFGICSLRRRSSRRREKSYELENREYKVVLKENGAGYSEIIQKGYDISRRSYDTIDPCGRALYLVDTSQGPKNTAQNWWPVVGNFPKESFEASHIKRACDSLKVFNTANGIETSIDIRLPNEDSSSEIWTIGIHNLTDKTRQLKVVPYLEWVLNRALDDRFHTQYARLFPVMEYVSGVNAVMAWHKNTKSMGILASETAPEGFLTSRMDFIGRAQSIWSPRVLKTLDFLDAVDTAPYPTFDPIGSLILGLEVAPKAFGTVRLMIGYATDKKKAIDLINKHLKIQGAKAVSPSRAIKKSPLIGHGEILPGTPQPYSEFIDNGNKLLVRTPYTPRPYDHTMSNELGHSIMVTNRGLHISSNGNSQQNRLTPDWPDTVTKEIPAEAIYLYDSDKNEWYSPTYHPLNDPDAKYESEFGVDGTAVFRMTKQTVSTELTVFVPPNDSLGVYLLTVRNNASYPRRMRIAPYFQIALSFQPELAGCLTVRYNKALGALFFENPRNNFRAGWAFASMSIASECVETKRGRFFGTGRAVSHPFLAEKGKSDTAQITDERTIAGLLATMEIPAHGEYTVAVILGETDDRKQATRLIQKYKNIETARKSLDDTRKWWLAFTQTVEVKTNNPEFDQLQNWLKYQTLAERIWARRGFYQSSGAFGFRDQLQDTVNLIWADSNLARRQIILHASHQFIEGDVLHWFFTLTDGRTAFASRSHASDNLLWLVWSVVEYIKYTGDDLILDEMTSYVVSEFPFTPLPRNKHGWGHLYHRSTRADSVYRHCLKSIDLVLGKRMGKHGLPLIGTGDWNDGLDEIGSKGKGESVWLGFFLCYILKDMVNIIEKREGSKRKEHYTAKMQKLEVALELTWRGDRYLRAIHDDGTEIGVKDSGVWEIDVLTAAWVVMCGFNPERALTMFNTAISVLEKENVILLGWPALREDTKPYLGRSCKYPEGVRENGMYCHGAQWLIKAARILAERFENQGNSAKADEYREAAYRLWLKIAPVSHVTPGQIEIYGGQPNKQAADLFTTFDQGRMIWNGYTGAASWMFRESLEGVVGAALINNEIILPDDLNKPRGELKVNSVHRDISKSPLKTA
jgi:cyclic beta-1,2-glucan synthetase